jgi:hypothetical protein
MVFVEKSKEFLRCEKNWRFEGVIGGFRVRLLKGRGRES